MASFDYSDHTARVIDALLLARAISGSEAGGAELAALRRLFDSGFDDDGLHYTPDNPWSFRHANMHYQRSVINGLLALSLVDGCERARELLRNLVDALDRISLAVGGFAGWSQPNDLFSKVMHDWDLYTCCSAQGVRGLFNAWTHATTFDGGTLSVNMLINSISRQAIVSSWLPAKGRIEVTPKQDCVVRMRKPDGVGIDDIDVSANGVQVQNTSVNNGYLQVPRVSNEDRLVFIFSMLEQHRREDILDVSYESLWRGDSIVNISPSGTRAPLYKGREVSENSVAMLRRDAPEIGFRLL